MAQAANVHEWIENFGEFDFEGVLICKNSLGKWDEGAALRAFQTFQWRDATTEGNDSSFAHITSGAVVRFDGEALAIEYGDDRLEEALPDLFDVLYSLGWRDVELYHPGPSAATNEFLGHIGRAIPARYADFDIHLAKVELAVSEFAEGAALIARGRQLMGGGVENEGAALLGEMQTLNVRAISGGVRASQYDDELPVAAVGQVGGIVLDDGEEMDDGEVLVVGARLVPTVPGFAPAAPVVPVELPNYPYLDDDDEAPRTFDLPGAGGDKDKGSMALLLEPEAETIGFGLLGQLQPQIQQQSQPEIQQQQQVQQPALQADEVPLLHVPQVRVAVPQKVEVLPDVAVKDSAEPAPRLPAKIPLVSDPELLESVITVGRSAFVFDLPANPMTDDDVLAVADEHGVGSKDVVHLHPGAMGEALRWDVFGEVAPAYPFFVEKLVGAMFAGVPDEVLVASEILALKQREPGAQLRDLLAVAIQKDSAHAMVDVAHRLGALSLAPAGQAFVDLMPSDMVESAADNSVVDHCFTVMSIVQSPAARLYVVHVDQLDGPFVLWSVSLLRFVVSNYAATKRYSCPVKEFADAVEVSVDASSGVETITAIAGEMTALISRLGKMGIKV